MTDFVTRDDTNLGVGRILTSPTMYAVYDNLFSLASGGLGAPRIQTAAIQDEAVTNAKLAGPTAGTANLICRLGESAFTTTSGYSSATNGAYREPTSAMGVTCLVAGTVTAYLQHRRVSDGTSFVRVLKNGSLVQQWSTTGGFVARQVNIAVNVGDSIVFQHAFGDDGFGGSSEWQLLRIYSNTNNFAVA